eukprot:UN05228
MLEVLQHLQAVMREQLKASGQRLAVSLMSFIDIIDVFAYRGIAHTFNGQSGVAIMGTPDDLVPGIGLLNWDGQ